MRGSIGLTVFLSLAAMAPKAIASPPETPAAADGWTITLEARTPSKFAPTTATAGRAGEVYVGGYFDAASSKSRGAVLRIAAGRVSTFAEDLNPVNGLERIGDEVFVVHTPTLSAFHVPGGDGRAEGRRDLVNGLSVASEAGSADEHGALAIRRGMDGFLYVAVGDKGIPGAVGKAGATIRMEGGGVVRVRPDGSELEIVSTGDARPTGLAIASNDDLFAFSAVDEPRWGQRLHQPIVGGRYGYPYEFVSAEFRALPPISKFEGRRSGQGAFFDAGPAILGEFAACDPDAQTVFRNVMHKAGGGSSLVTRTPLVTRGGVPDFHPRSIAADQRGFWLVDAGSTGGGNEQATGRIYRLLDESSEPESVVVPPRDGTIETWVGELDQPSRSRRLDAQDHLEAAGPAAVAPLIARLNRPEPLSGRLHALWALDRTGTAPGGEAIRAALLDASPQLRLHAARSAGIRRDLASRDGLAKLLSDRDPAVRREAAIALGRLGDRAVVPALLASLGDGDRYAAWTIRRAILELGCDDLEALVSALIDPRRREAALLLADESWSTSIVEALVNALPRTPEPAVRGRMLACLAGQYRRYPDWSGAWYGPKPLAGPRPKKTEPWEPAGMAAVLKGLEQGLGDADASVRYQAVFGLQAVGPPAGPLLREALAKEPDGDNQAALVEALGALNDAASTRLLLPIVVDSKRPEAVRSAALDALNRLRGRDVVRARLTILYEEDAPDTLVAKALPALARDGFLPPNDLAGFLHHASPLVRAAAVMSLNPSRPLPADVKNVVLARLDDEDSDVRRAAFLAAGPLKLREAVPRLVEKAGSTRDDDRTAILAALCSLPDPRALPLYVAALDDPDPSLRRGSLGALLAIRDRVEPDLRRLAAKGGRSPDAALALERVLARLEPVRNWRLLGPMPPQAFDWMAPDGSIDPSRSYPGPQGEAVRWTRGAESREGVVELAATPNPALAAVTVAHAEFPSDTARRALLVVESDGPIQVALNGQVVLPVTSEGKEAPEQFAATLVKGVNHLTVSGNPGASGRRFVVSFAKPGEPMNR
ncbi:HEAT repeat domain-containing protein [Paludisphaera mucosa]|uniref:HEAT repeat domain-containing protein n=1 Tax=Paludisphaera mucosa TaxID=3030827 RepID=A0ABT6F888_9BACT|nr:HEAT repeat domain-containing protein [Paludisphaera mucosa]MDG3003701.1 HEAT repeat domain-containing protein [Paludisphaera mucosa]